MQKHESDAAVVEIEPFVPVRGIRTEVHITDLQHCALQPPWRTTETALRTLAAEIAESKYVAPVILVPNVARVKGLGIMGWTPDEQPSPTVHKFIVADGTRRAHISHNLGGTTLIAELLGEDVDANERWLALNRATKRVGGPEMFYAWAQRPDAKLTPHIKGQIELIVKWVGEKEAKKLGNQGTAPVLAGAVTRVLSLFRDYKLTCPKSPGAIFFWMMQHGQNQFAQYVKSRKGQSELTTAKHVMRCIMRDTDCWAKRRPTA